MRYILAILIAIVPLLWIEDYYFTNAVWWTVIGAWHLGTLFGSIYKD